MRKVWVVSVQGGVEEAKIETWGRTKTEVVFPSYSVMVANYLICQSEADAIALDKEFREDNG